MQETLITYREMLLEEAHKIAEVDRSEQIEQVYRITEGQLISAQAGHECPSWNDEQLYQLITRMQHELTNGGLAWGAFDGKRLVGFAVLGSKWCGVCKDHLQVDLMYVNRAHRRKGIASQLMRLVEEEAKARGASYLYISSTETESAVRFYQSHGSEWTAEADEELFTLEPLDIHMIKHLK
ncbi:hypothetical protein Back11_07020 [Paenibacillus baekrokdamisoli]|uniref:Uncharacterized protein n=1 Tax=Paenibacillus baekrokdamisoli TaxID=1712516 RepID=A0A3G9IK29_9BACL|nr:GNAT family N-acetyltransferase [Paenibacillus baekrokdamisoli]MBB3067456.1 ribosomal protein S18 acetylase RimI-like enzyme [Paenibacillus baekrokdamisoli]BBH19357.1 hypothetical protein Back11_07020 [Paenibacillus baekrokdamisoli]